MNNNFVLECCVDSVESSINARDGGANRLELCSNLSIGGTTPSVFLFNLTRSIVDIDIHVLIRPRFGDFLYTNYEKDIIKREVELFRDAGAQGVVVGALCKNGELDFKFMKEIVSLAGGMKVILHRAFDMCCDPFDALHKSIELGVNTILTSGQQSNCLEGIDLISKLYEEGKGKIDIMAGSGMNLHAVKEFLQKTSIKSFHMSAKRVLDSQMEFRNQNVSMGLPSLSEYEIFRTDEEQVRLVREVLEKYFSSGRL